MVGENQILIERAKQMLSTGRPNFSATFAFLVILNYSVTRHNE